MTEPTDNELDALILQHWPAAATATLPLRWIRAAFREGLARWGSPAGAGEVVAYLDIGTGYLDLGTALSNDELLRLPKGRHALVIAGTYGVDGYTAPQPTQPQTGAVPLTDEQLYSEKQTAIPQLFDLARQWADNQIHSYQFSHEAEKIVDAVARRVEAAHGIGIKGGQHGTE
jgi:hypothetical protein